MYTQENVGMQNQFGKFHMKMTNSLSMCTKDKILEILSSSRHALEIYYFNMKFYRLTLNLKIFYNVHL